MPFIDEVNKPFLGSYPSSNNSSSKTKDSCCFATKEMACSGNCFAYGNKLGIHKLLGFCCCIRHIYTIKITVSIEWSAS